MASGSMKDMIIKENKLEKFEGVDFRRWQKKMHFLLSSLKVVYVLTTPIPEIQEEGNLEQIRKRSKWENDNYICLGHILNGMSDPLFDVYQNVETAKLLWDTLEAKYMAEDSSSKKFLVSNFNNYKMVDERPVMEQYHELLRILGQFAQHDMKMDESISVSSIIDKLPPSWRDVKHNLKHQKGELTLVELGSHFRIEEGLRAQENVLVNDEKKRAGSSSVNMVETGESSKGNSKFKGKRKFQGNNNSGSNKKPNYPCWKCGKVGHFKKDCKLMKKNKKSGSKDKQEAGSSGSKDPGKQGQNLVQFNNSVQNYVSLISEAFYVQDDDIAWWVDSGATSHVCKDLRWFKDFQPIEDGSIIKMGNVATEPIKGIGTVNLVFTSGKTLLLNNVLYAPGIRKNLLSGIVLNNCGYKQVLESDKYILSRHGTFVGFGYLCNGMFMLNVDVSFMNESVCVASTSNANCIASTSRHNLTESELWHARLGHVHYKRVKEMSKMSLIPPINVNNDKCHVCKLNKITKKPFMQHVHRETKVLDLIHSDLCDFHATPSLGNKKYVVTFIDDSTRFCYVYLLHAKDEALEKFKIYKQEVELHRSGLIKTLHTDRGGEYFDPVYFQSTGIIHHTTAPYTPEQNGVAERKNRTLKEMVNTMLSYSGLSEGFWGEAMLTACYLLNRVPNKRNKTTPHELWYRKPPELHKLRVWGCRAVVRLTDPKIRNIGERGIDCIFIGYAEHSFAHRFYVIEPNDYVSVHTVIEARNAEYDENRFSSMPRPRDMVPSSSNSHVADQVIDTPPELRRSGRARKAKSFGDDFQLYLVEGSRDEIKIQYQYCFNIEEDPKTYSEAMASRDVAFWKEAINDEMDSIMQNNTWKLSDLPPGCKPLGCKWIFKKKMKVDGSIEKFKARLVIQGFRQKEGIDYFDTYAPVARISTIRLLVALAAIHNLVIHQMDVKTAFLNGDLDEEIYMKQPEGFVMPGNEHKVCKLVKSLYGLKQAPKQWHQKFDEVVLSNGFVLNQADKCVYSKFDDSRKGVIICLYVDDMLIFGTDQDQVDKTKKFLSSCFDMKDLGEAEVILGIRIKRENNGISISQSHYIEKILKKFNFHDSSPVSTPMDPAFKLSPNEGVAVSQLEYSRAIGSLMYAMISTRPDIAYAVGKLSRYTSNPGASHWQAMNRVFRYLKGTMKYGLTYTGFPSVLEGYSDASWIKNKEDHSSTSGWTFLLGGGAISWASKKQTCITDSTMESEFVALAAAGKEAEWLRNLIYEIPLWPKPISPISIRCDSAATLAKAYSQVYNGKSRHLGVRHSMIRELITQGVISVEFVRTQQNLADHLTKELCRDLVHKAAVGMGLKST
ncbi:putative RNA-directed DNA polymerase [Helianthus annuus]|nr:putative RNA-directed DNA polymerase [Helianthus annuus]KAJ0894896.1 putative RNA-directed DNA polymerase [Helianthus annuus]